MNAFQFREWWRYRRAAKGRHGVHSPFVYRFVDEGLQAKVPVEVRRQLRLFSVSAHEHATARTLFFCLKFLQPQAVHCVWTPARKTLIASILAEANVRLSKENAADSADCILLGGDDSNEVERCFTEHAERMKDGVIFIVAGIHASPLRALLWLRLYEDARVNLSIDLWHIGLLFYHPDFKEKQHFVLKYPA